MQVLPGLQGGGVERGTLEIGKALVDQGHRSLVMSAGGRMVEQLENEGSEHFAWPIGKKSLWTLRLIWKLRRFLVEQHVDILHVRSRMPGWVCYLAWKGMDPTTRPKLVTTVHGLYSVGPYSAVMTKGERVIAVSETVRRYIQDNYPEVDPARIVLIPRGVDPAEFPHGYRPADEWLQNWQAQHPQLAGKQVLTLPGRLTRLKGHEDFITLMYHLKQQGLPVHGLIVGGEDPRRRAYAQELRNKIMEVGLSDTITLTGHRSDLKDIMAVSTIVFSLSSKPESFGRTTLEALSLGIPVIGYDHGGVGEILAALLPEMRVPVGEIDAITARVVAFLEHPVPVEPVNHFRLQDMLNSTVQAYEKLTSDPIPATSLGVKS